MKPILAALIAAPLMILMGGCSHHHVATTASGKTVYGEQAEIVQRLSDAGDDLKQLMNAPDNAIPQDVLADANCVAVVPDMVKGGFIFGANHGRGIGTCRSEHGWSQPAFFVITGGSWGAQIGVESVDLVMVFLGDEGMHQLLSSRFKLGAEAGVAGGPVGREAQASTDWKMKNKILVYSRTRGLFAGINLSGAAVRPDDDSTRAYYGKPVEFKETLMGHGPRNENSNLFLEDVRQAFREAKAKEASESK